MPLNIAIITNGNRRWAKHKFIPAAVGHAAGVERVRDIVKACTPMNVVRLSIFAFSTKNWKRPAEEVTSPKILSITCLQKEVDSINVKGISKQWVTKPVSRQRCKNLSCVCKSKTPTTSASR